MLPTQRLGTQLCKEVGTLLYEEYKAQGKTYETLGVNPVDMHRLREGTAKLHTMVRVAGKLGYTVELRLVPLQEGQET